MTRFQAERLVSIQDCHGSCQQNASGEVWYDRKLGSEGFLRLAGRDEAPHVSN